MVGDGQSVAQGRHQQILAWHAETVEAQAVVVGVPEGIDAIGHDLEMLILRRRQVGDKHRRLALEHHHQADSAAGNAVGDEQLFPCDFVVVTRQGRCRAQGGEI